MAVFPLLSLPLELQLRVIKNIDDISTLLTVLAVPQVLASVGPLIRYVTNGKSQSTPVVWNFFRSVGPRMVNVALGDLAKDQEKSKERAVLYIVDLVYTPSLDVGQLAKVLKNKDVFITLNISTDGKPFVPQLQPVRGNGPPRRPGDKEAQFIIKFLEMCRDLELCAVGVFADKAIELNVGRDGRRLPWPKNLSLSGFDRIVVDSPITEIEEEEGGAYLQPIRYLGSNVGLWLAGSFNGTTEQITKACWTRYSELIEACPSPSIYPSDNKTTRFVPDHTIAIDGLKIRSLTGQFSLRDCHTFANVDISGVAQDTATFNDIFCSYFDFNLVPKKTPDGPVAPLIADINAPGVQRIEFSSEAILPKFRNVWIPNVHYLVLRREWCSEKPLKIDIDAEQRHHLSEMISLTDELELDRFTTCILSQLTPRALYDLKVLVLFDRPCEKGSVAEKLKLRPGQGKVDLPNLNDLLWHTEAQPENAFLDFNKFRSLFEVRELGKLIFESDCTKIQLKSIVEQMPDVFEIEVRKATKTGDPIEQVYPTLTKLTKPNIFYNLHKMEIRHGHFPDMFKGVSFPALHTLSIYLQPKNLTGGIFTAEMPSLETLTLIETYAVFDLNPVADSAITVSSFPKLKKCVVENDIGHMKLIDCPEVEHIELKGSGLKTISSHTQLKKLKFLKYISPNGKPLHTFDTPAGINLKIVSGGNNGIYDDLHSEGDDFDEQAEEDHFQALVQQLMRAQGLNGGVPDIQRMLANMAGAMNAMDEFSDEEYDHEFEPEQEEDEEDDDDDDFFADDVD